MVQIYCEEFEMLKRVPKSKIKISARFTYYTNDSSNRYVTYGEVSMCMHAILLKYDSNKCSNKIATF